MLSEIKDLKEKLLEMESIKARLSESEERFNSLYNSINAVLFKADTDGRIFEVSSNLNSVFGIKESDFVNKNIGEVLWDPYNRGNLLSKMLDETPLGDYDLRMSGPDCSEIYVLLGSRITKSKINDTNCIEGIIRDVSELRLNEEEIKKYVEEVQESQLIMEQNAHDLIMLNSKLEESEQKLQKLNASKDKFFSIIAHDLKSPFTVMLGFTEMLEIEFEDLSKEELREAVVALNRTAQNVFELLEGLLDWSRVQTGRMEFSPRRFNLTEVVNSVIELLNENAHAKKIELINEVKNNLYVFADRNMINAVLRNLITNAVKFTNQGGKVTVKTLKKNEFVQITIQDTGIGISEDNIAKLFRIDVHHTTYGTNNEKGTGLGLILCKELVEKNKGKIWIESKLGKGSKFNFTIPSRVIHLSS